ncbi:60S acidic ribosomal protein P1 [Teleopsis dalmanni]|uniref:60S acidic ribosomal protein P1 n=1 Tax=Teleopsis dalmanni TaxID=139649 RepID=UPI0018CF008A|nr:60S acidic ribosomal protein P1 [Teleopsis dalmanni]
MSNKAELSCVYAALILVDDEVAITGEKIQTILKAANVEVEPYWPGLFAKALEGVNIKDLITNIGSGVGAAAPAGGAAPASDAAPAAEAKKEEKKKEEEPEESDDDMGFGLFD